MRATALALGSALGLAAATCGGEDPVPASPTWVDDVEPIIRGNCAHCHSADRGADGIIKGDGNRFDISDPASYGALAPVGAIGAKMMLPLILSAVTRDARRMPPAPATKLSDRAVRVLEAWAATGFARGTRTHNAKPTAALEGTPQRIGATLAVTILVKDDDGEVVVGKLTCGTAAVELPRAGRYQVTLDVVSAVPTGSPLTAELSDGQDAVTISLGSCP